MTDVVPEVRRTQMSPRDRRRFLIAFAALTVLLFIGGAVGYVLDFRHQNVCPGGKMWISRTSDPLGQVSYVCPNGKTVTQGLVP